MVQQLKIGYLIFIFLLFGGMAELQAQQFGTNVKQEGEVKLKQENSGFKPDVRVSLGTSFTGFGPGFNTFGTFIAPDISMPVSKKFSLSVGLGYSSYFNSVRGENLFGASPSQYGNVYLSGTYLVNEKLSIRGTAYKTFLLNPAPPGSKLNPHALDFSNQGVILDMNYKVNDHFRINASFEYRQQNYPGFYNNGIGGYGNYQGSPFIYGPGF